jgi:DNA processing protein
MAGSAMDAEDLKYWVALKEIEGLGNIGYRVMIDVLGSPRKVFQASPRVLMSVSGVGQKIADAIARFDGWVKVDGVMNKTARMGATFMTCRDASYPANLLQIHDYPPLLYVLGTLANTDVNIAVVGSRAASVYGKYATEKLCRELALKGITVVSGLARGIDAAAHRGALAGKGRTIAVLGCGLDVSYPPENAGLLREIAGSGAVVTEFALGTPPHGANFPARNRIISGMSLGVVVVEATDKSGSLITARLALEQNREVFAVPGSIDSPGSKGTNKLIKEGAKLVAHVDDILDEIMPQVERGAGFGTPLLDTVKMQGGAESTRRRGGDPPEEASVNDAERVVLRALSSEPAHVDAVIGKTNLPPHEVLSILLTLELQGLVAQLPGKKYIRRSNNA